MQHAPQAATPPLTAASPSALQRTAAAAHAHHAVHQGSERSAVGQRRRDAEVQDVHEDVLPEGDAIDASNAYAYVSAQTLVQVLKQCADDFSSDNILKQATSLKNFTPELILPGISINSASNDYETFDQLRLATFDSKTWVTDKAE